MPKEDTQFKPGQSGNPSGQPRAARLLKQAIVEWIQADREFHKKIKHRDGTIEEKDIVQSRLDAFLGILDEEVFAKKERWALEKVWDMIAPKNIDITVEGISGIELRIIEVKPEESEPDADAH